MIRKVDLGHGATKQIPAWASSWHWEDRAETWREADPDGTASSGSNLAWNAMMWTNNSPLCWSHLPIPQSFTLPFLITPHRIKQPLSPESVLCVQCHFFILTAILPLQSLLHLGNGITVEDLRGMDPTGSSEGGRTPLWLAKSTQVNPGSHSASPPSKKMEEDAHEGSGHADAGGWEGGLGRLGKPVSSLGNWDGD